MCTFVSIFGGLFTDLILWDLLAGNDEVDFDFLGLETFDFEIDGEGACEVNTVWMGSWSEEDGNTVVIGVGLYSRNGIQDRLMFGGGDGGGDTAWWEGERGDSSWWGEEGGGDGGIGGGSVSEVSGGKFSFSDFSILREKKNGKVV